MGPLFPSDRKLPGVVVGRIRGDDLELLRAEFAKSDHSVPLRVARVRSATVTWEDGTALGEPLEHLLGWRSDEPVVLSVPTPALAGGSFTMSLGTDARVDERELLLRARWEAREDVREATARYFGCALEDVGVIAEDAVRLRSSAPGMAAVRVTSLARATSQGDSDLSAHRELTSPPDITTCQFVLLPVLLGELLPPSQEPVGLYLLEEMRLSLLVWHGGALQWVRTLPIGGDLLFRHLTEELHCSPRDAAILLQRADGGSLAAEPTRVLLRVLRPLLPLFSGAWQIFGEELSPSLRPTQLLVSGLWPALVNRLFCRPQFRSRCTHPRAVPRVLPVSVAFERDPELSSGGAVAPGARLLRHMIDVVAREAGGSVKATGASGLQLAAPAGGTPTRDSKRQP